MNLREIRKRFSDMCRTGGIDSMDPLRDDWINSGWRKITEQFVIPSLTKTVYDDTVADQQFYNLPYDYNGADIGFVIDGRRLDPVSDEVLRLKYERAEGGYGRPRLYDWSGVVGEDLYLWDDATVNNESAVVAVAHPAVTIGKNTWMRFDPYQDSTEADADVEGWIDPYDYGFMITPGVYGIDEDIALEWEYRGPSGISFGARIRPAETQRFVVYGTPSSSGTDNISIRYSSQPRRLYNDTDVPEWPSIGEAIANMAISIGFEYNRQLELSKMHWGRAVSSITGLKRRREGNKTLTTDLSIGSVSGRKTGIHGSNGMFNSRGMYRCR